jgi:GNAT superfamily N-acetyltransferase
MRIFHKHLGLLAVERAEQGELTAVMTVLEDAAAWLHSIGIRYQWPSPLHEGSWNRTREGIEKGHVYLVRTSDGCPIGTARVEWTDKYGAWSGFPKDAGYVRSFATVRSVRGHGVGAALLEWAQQHIRSRRRRYLRLRCCGINAELCEYYEARGFTFCGQVQGGMWLASLYQMEL